MTPEPPAPTSEDASRWHAHFDVDEDATVETVADGDPWWYFAFDARWRTVARAVERDGSTPAIVEQWVHHHAGLAESGSSSYIDSVILRDRDTNADGTLDERVYYLQNWRADVVALITGAGAQVEQVRYEPYGSPFGIPAGDVDASGAVDGTDATAVTAWYNAPSYDVRGDLDMDGDIDTTDLALLEDAKDAAASLGLYHLSTVDNRKGYAGYELLGELSEAKWDVRNRVLNSRLGRWDQRDPLGYVDGMSLAAYASSSPVFRVDPIGTRWSNIDFVWHYWFGFGSGVNLGDVGLGELYENHPAVIDGLVRIGARIETHASSKLLELMGRLDCSCDGAGPTLAFDYESELTESVSISRRDFIQDWITVDDINALLQGTPNTPFWTDDWTFAIGGHRLIGTYDCAYVAWCASATLKMGAALCPLYRATMKDRFADPFGLDIEAGIPYDIRYEWNPYLLVPWAESLRVPGRPCGSGSGHSSNGQVKL